MCSTFTSSFKFEQALADLKTAGTGATDGDTDFNLKFVLNIQ